MDDEADAEVGSEADEMPEGETQDEAPDLRWFGPMRVVKFDRRDDGQKDYYTIIHDGCVKRLVARREYVAGLCVYQEICVLGYEDDGNNLINVLDNPLAVFMTTAGSVDVRNDFMVHSCKCDNDEIKKVWADAFDVGDDLGDALSKFEDKSFFADNIGLYKELWAGRMRLNEPFHRSDHPFLAYALYHKLFRDYADPPVTEKLLFNFVRVVDANKLAYAKPWHLLAAKQTKGRDGVATTGLSQYQDVGKAKSDWMSAVRKAVDVSASRDALLDCWSREVIDKLRENVSYSVCSADVLRDWFDEVAIYVMNKASPTEPAYLAPTLRFADEDRALDEVFCDGHVADGLRIRHVDTHELDLDSYFDGEPYAQQSVFAVISPSCQTDGEHASRIRAGLLERDMCVPGPASMLRSRSGGLRPPVPPSSPVWGVRGACPPLLRQRIVVRCSPSFGMHQSFRCLFDREFIADLLSLYFSGGGEDVDEIHIFACKHAVCNASLAGQHGAITSLGFRSGSETWRASDLERVETAVSWARQNYLARTRAAVPKICLSIFKGFDDDEVNLKEMLWSEHCGMRKDREARARSRMMDEAPEDDLADAANHASCV